MDRTLPEHQAITAVVPTVPVKCNDQPGRFPLRESTHFVLRCITVRQETRRDHAIMSKALFGTEHENQLELLNSARVHNREFILFSNAHRPDSRQQGDKASGRERQIRVVHVECTYPKRGVEMELGWTPAREDVCQLVQHCERCLLESPLGSQSGKAPTAHLAGDYGFYSGGS
ncbi:hypothetical protein AOCH_003081 [Aspergillus ochraceoroseus]|uniref:Uncharacterized protein n=1 Tax=Aspergillus ochraceoroseus TaxID=138278 RepID=A0A0F8UQD4_9EURO|nr:hypothetical protein AOCH_003081 [Aspergillus ochraceoroseus]